MPQSMMPINMFDKRIRRSYYRVMRGKMRMSGGILCGGTTVVVYGYARLLLLFSYIVPKRTARVVVFLR